MRILIDKIRISGFRGLSNIEMSLPRVTLLLGTNNSGKTSVIKALQLAIGDYGRFLRDEDFHIDQDEKRQEKIVIDIRLAPVNASGKLQPTFEDEWMQEFGDNIQSKNDGSQYLAVRTIGSNDKVKGGYTIERYALETWPQFAGWQDHPISKRRRLSRQFSAIPFIFINAQRDIHQELKEKTSFIGRVLSDVAYDDADVEKLEEMIAQINQEAIEKSEPLKKLKRHLNFLSQSFEGTGHTDLTPFPKKIRDLSKSVTVHFGESDTSSFSMEYHGMGTRSWASMLTVKALLELMAENHEKEAEPFFPVLAAEEPEAHLHPNAQRTLYQQLVNNPGQVIISTHSPYLAAMADIRNLRGLVKKGSRVKVTSLTCKMNGEDIHILHREIMRFRGEILFARAIVLFEGVTEEQLAPAMFEAYFGYTPFAVGVNCISVGGKNYPPFIKMACSFGIPVCIVSDNDGRTREEITSQIAKIKYEMHLALDPDAFFVSYLSPGNDMEAELLNVQGLRQEIIEALVQAETRGSDNPDYTSAKTNEMTGLNDDEILQAMRNAKASYAGFLAHVISCNPHKKSKEDLVPLAMREAFDKLKAWMS